MLTIGDKSMAMTAIHVQELDRPGLMGACIDEDVPQQDRDGESSLRHIETILFCEARKVDSRVSLSKTCQICFSGNWTTRWVFV